MTAMARLSLSKRTATDQKFSRTKTPTRFVTLERTIAYIFANINSTTGKISRFGLAAPSPRSTSPFLLFALFLS